MSSRIRATKPIGTYTLDGTGGAITTSAWTQVTASVVNAGSALEVFNATGATLIVSQGASGHETEAGNLLPYTIPQGGSSILLPLELKSGKPIRVKSLDNASGAGLLILNLFG